MIMPTVKTRIFALGCLFELASAPVVQTVAQNGQYIYDVQDGEADIFGQLRYEKNVNGTGLVKLNTANPNGYKWVSDYGYQAGVTPITTAGTYVGSEYYAYETTLYANTLMPRAISVVDVNTGEFHTASNIFLYGKDNFQTETTGSARIAFQACSEANHGQIYLKDVSIREYSTKNLSVQALTGSQLVNSQSQQTFTVDVRNEGSATVNDYRVLLLNADNNAEAYTFPARIGIKNTTRTDMLDEDGFTTVLDGNITIQGNANDLELVVNLDKPYKYEGGNVIMKFECPLGTQYIKDSMEHPDWHMMEMDGNPHIAYCSGEDEDANVWGELLMPFISIASKDNGSTGIFAIGGDKNGVTRSGDSLLFDECADEARLYSATGALVANAQRANALSVAGLAKGIYVLKLTKGGAVRSLKVEF